MRRFKPPHPCAFPAVLDAAWAATGYGLGYVMQDPDAIAYVAAVEAAGVTVTNDQRTAIDIFVTTGKSDGWYSSLKRLYLPIWESAAPNAIDMISRTSGTFVGGVTHSPGWLLFNGSTGYFNLATTPAAVGMTNATGWMGALLKNCSANQQYLGAVSGGNQCVLRHTTLPAVISDYMDSIAGRLVALVSSEADKEGIVSFRRLSGTRALNRRKSAGRVVLGSRTDADSGTGPGLPLFFGARNNAGTADQFTNIHGGAVWMGTGVSDVADAAFTAALKTLWETLTGLTIP